MQNLDNDLATNIRINSAFIRTFVAKVLSSGRELDAGGGVVEGFAGFFSDTGLDELSEDDKLTVARARKIQRFFSQPFFVGEQFTGLKGEYVKVEDTVKGFKEILEGKCDDMPEQSFYMVGTIEQAREKAKNMAAAA